MVFSSLSFVCVFLPLVFIAHNLIPGIRVKNLLLIAASLLFYSYGEPVFVVLMLASTLLNYLFGRAIGRANRGKPELAAKLLLALAVLVNLGILAVFKYANMIAASVLGVVEQLSPGAGQLALDPPLLEILLPIGISFYTFQALSYVIDVYRGQVTAQRNYLNILLYISFFPQLVAGPIVKYHDIAAQLRNRKVNASRAALGFRRFCVGLAKKVLVANTLALGVDAIYAAPDGSINAAVAWLAALGYMLQIYYDFSGYSDMAIGMGKMFGFDFKENFRYPYVATTIQEFWRRWHISLSTWFKEYLYIPLGGNRKGRARTALNKLIVFFCTGLWHGASWTFVAWGLFHGCFLLLEGYLPVRKAPRFLGHIYALLVVCLGFVLFRAADFGQAGLFIAQMFTGWQPNAAATQLALSQLNPLFILSFVAGVAGAFGLPTLVRRLFARRRTAPTAPAPTAPAAPAPAPSLSQSPSPSAQNSREKDEAVSVSVATCRADDIRPYNQTTCRADGIRPYNQREKDGAGLAPVVLPNGIKALSYAGSLVLLALCLLFLASGGYNPFIYFRF